MKSIDIQDFTQGRNTLDSQLLLANGQCVATSLNVWAPTRALTKTPGTAILYSFTATALDISSIYSDDTINTGFKLYYRIQSSLNQTGYYPWAGESDSLTPLGYTTGTVSVSGASRVSATGNGTSWTTNVSAGDMFRVNASASNWVLVSSVEDDTHLTLSAALPASVATGSAYTIMPALDRIETPWASLNGSWWSSTTANVMQRYDGTGMTRIPSAPKVAFLAPYKGYLFGLRTSTGESRLYWSAFNAPTSWPINNFIDIDKARGKGAGLIAFGNEVIVIKTKGMHKVVGDTFDPANPTYAVYPIATPPSFQFNSNWSAVVHKGTLYLVGRNAIYAYQQGTSTVVEVSQQWSRDLPTSFSAIDSVTGIDQRISGISFQDHLLIKGFSYANGQKSTLGMLDSRGAWWIARNENESTTVSPFGYGPFAVLNSSNAKPKLVITSGTNPRVYTYDILTHLSGGTPEDQYIDPATAGETAISAEWRSKEFNIEFGTFKTLVIYLQKQSVGSLSVDWSIDQGAFVTNSVDMTVGRGNLIRKVLPINQTGSTIQIRITQSTANQTFTVYGMKVYYETALEDRKA